MPPDTSHTQKAAALARGNATVEAPTCRGTIAVARPRSSGSTPRNSAAVECRVKRRSAVSGSKISLPEASASSKSTSAPATPDATRNSRDVPTKSLPMVRGSPDPDHRRQARRRSRRGGCGGGLYGGVAGSFGHCHERTLVRRRAVLGNLVTWVFRPRKSRSAIYQPDRSS